MRTKNLYLLSFLIICGCNNHPSSSESVEETPSTINFNTYGRAFMQPLDTLLSLNMAGAEAYILIDFLDAEYCNVLISSVVGNIKKDKKYKIENDTISFIDPAINDVKKFSITRSSSGIYLSKDRIKWRMVLSGNSEYDNLNSNNSIKRKSFLYPVLNDAERQFGAGDRFFVDKGRTLRVKSHPLKMKARESDFFNYF